MTLDITIFLGFLAVNLLFGLLSSRGIKTIREYAVGDKKFSTATIVATIVATWVSGEFFVTIVAETYIEGISFIAIVVLGDFLALFLVGFLFAPRMAEFLGKLSIAEAMGDLYGNNVRTITAVSGFIGVSGIIAIQLKIAGLLFQYALGIPIIYGVVLSGITITLYSSLGGIKSVTFTDVIQFFSFGVIIPTIAYFLFSNIENNQVITDTFTENPLFDYTAVFSFANPQIYYYFSIFLWIVTPSFNPAIFQRIVMAGNVKQSSSSFIIASGVVFLLAAIVCWIGVLVLAIYPNIAAGDILKLIISDYAWITGFKGLILAGIMAMVMSTVDSYINSSAVLLTHDLRESLRVSFIKNELFATRVCSMLIGLIAILFAMRSGSFLEMFIWASMFYMPIVTVPFMMSIFGFRSSSKSVLIGMSAGFVVAIIWELFFKVKMGNVGGLIPGMLANLIFLIGSHYLLKQKGGWVGIKDQESFIALKVQRQQKLKRLWRNIVSFNFLDVCRKNTPKSEGLISLLGLFVMISTFSSVNTIPKELQKYYASLFDILYPLTLCSSTVLISYPLWLQKWKETNVMAVFWNIIMFFVLICFSFLTVLISDFSEIQLMVFMINILMISSLISWRWSLFCLVLGVFITLFFYENYSISYQMWSEVSSLEFKIIYLLLLISSTLIMFLKPKQEQQELTDRKIDYQSHKIEDQKQELSKALELKYEFLRNLPHETNTPLTGVTSLGEALYYSYDQLSDEQRKGYLKNIAESSIRLKSYTDNLIDLSKLSSMNYEFNMEDIDLGELVYQRAELCRKLYVDEKNKDQQQLILAIEDNVIVTCDKHYMSQVIDNIIINAIQYCTDGKIAIRLARTKQKEPEFSVRDEGIGVAKEELQDIFGAFIVSSNTRTPAGGRGVGLALCKKIIDLHKGIIYAKQNSGKGVTLVFTLPKKQN